MKGAGGLIRAVALGGALVLAGTLGADAQSAEQLYREGVAARMERRFDDAVSALERAAALESRNADIRVQLGFTHLAAGRLDAASDEFDRALAIAPSYEDARFGLAEIAFRRGNLDRARTLVRQVVTAQPDNKDAAALLGKIEQAATAGRTARPAGRPAGTGASGDRAAAQRRSRLAAILGKARALRIAGRFAESEALYRQALALAPNDADILVSLGLVSGFQQKLDAAERFFDAALKRAPGNVDARLGLVRLALWRGEIGEARRLVDPILARDPANADAQLLAARIALAERRYDIAEAGFRSVAARDGRNVDAVVGIGDVRRARGDEPAAREAFGRALVLQPDSADIRGRLAVPAPKKWRLDLGSELSELSGGRPSWTDSAAALSYRLTPATTIGGTARVTTRNDRADVQLTGRIDHVFTDRFSAYGLFAATPDADFLADYSIGAGASWRVLPRAGGWGPLYLDADLRYDIFADSRIATVAPGLQYFLANERLGLSLRWIHAEDDAGTVADGYVLRADLAATDRLGLFAGYADAPEISAGSLVDTNTVFTGLSFALNDDVTVRTSYAHETRDAFDRDTVGFGLALRF